MSHNRASRGVPLPTIGQLLALSAALCALWLFWSEFGRVNDGQDRSRLSTSLIERMQAIDELVEQGADGLPELLAMLRSPDSKTRGDALTGLLRLGPAAAGAAGAVREQLADADPGVRSRAIPAIMQIYPDTKAAAGIIAPLLVDADEGVRATAEEELISVGSNADRVVAEMLSSRQAEARTAALRFFRTRELRPPRAPEVVAPAVVASVRELLGDADPGVQFEARALLVVWRMAGPAEAAELLRSASPEHIRLGLKAVAALPDHAEGLTPEILAALDRLNLDKVGPSVLTDILGSLSAMKSGLRPAIPRLAKLLESREPEVRVAVARALVDIGADPATLVPGLTPLLTHTANSVVVATGRLLVEIDPDEARRQVRLIVPRLHAQPGAVNRSALAALSAMRSQAGEAIPALLPLLEQTDVRIVEQVLGMLVDIGRDSPAVLAILVSSLGSDTIGIDRRVAYARALGNLGPAGEAAVPALRDILDRPTAESEPRGGARLYTALDLRVAAIAALGRIQPDDPQVIGALRSQLLSRFPKVRVPALIALGRADVVAPIVLADLVAHLADEDASVRTHAALTIGQMKSDRSAAVPALTAALGDENPFVRTASAMALKKVGRSSEPALPALRNLLNDPENSRINSEFGRSEGLRRDPFDPSIPPPVPVPLELYSQSVTQAARAAIVEIEAALVPQD
jgi:HEAT repeat protein